MTGPRTPTVAPWRRKLQAVLVILVGVISLGAAAALTYFYVRNTGEMGAYRAAPVCASPSAALTGESCRYTGAVTVAGRSRQTKLSIDLRFDALPDRTFTATFATDREPDTASVSVGAHLTALLWGGHVTSLAGVATTDDPEFLPTSNFLTAAAVFGIAGVIVIFWGAQFGRIAWR